MPLKAKIERKYNDNDISEYVDLYIRRNLQGYKTYEANGREIEYSFLINDEYIDIDGNSYIIAITPAIDTQELASPIAIYLSNSLQPSPIVHDNRKDVFDELMPILITKATAHVKILFPYNISQFHWLTGEIRLHKNGNNYTLEGVFAHNPYGEGVMDELNYAQIISAVLSRIKNFHNEAEIDIHNARKESAFLRRQDLRDGDSCGVIVAEDILKRIQGQSLDRNEIYPIGARELRESQLKLFVDNLPDNDATRINFLGRNAIIVNEVETSSITFGSLIDKFKQENPATHPQIIEDMKSLSEAIVLINSIILQITNKNSINLVESIKKFGSTIKSISHSGAKQSIYTRCFDLGINLKSLSYLQKIFEERNIDLGLFERINIINDFNGLKVLLLHVIANTFGSSFVKENSISLLNHDLVNLIDKPIVSIYYIEKFISLHVMLFSCAKINFALETIRSIDEEDIKDNGDLYLSRQTRYVFGNAVIALGEGAKELRDHLIVVESEAFSGLLKELGDFRDLVKVRPQVFISYSDLTSQLLQILRKHEALLTEVFKYMEEFIKAVFLTKYLNNGLLGLIVDDKKVEDAASDFKHHRSSYDQISPIEKKFETLSKYSAQLYEFEQKLELLFLSNLLDQASIKDGAETRRNFDTALEVYTCNRGHQVDSKYPIFNEDILPQDIAKARNQYKLNEEKRRLARDLEIVINESEFQEKVFLDIMKAIPKPIEIKREEISTTKLIVDGHHREVLLFSQAIVGTRYYFINDEKQYPNYCKIIRKKQHPLLAKAFKELRDLRMDSLMHGDNEDVGDYNLLQSSRSLTTAWIEDVKALRVIITSNIEKIRQDVFDANDINQLALATATFVKYYESLSKFESIEGYEAYLNALLEKFNIFKGDMQEEHYKRYAELLHVYAYYLLSQSDIESAMEKYREALALKKQHMSLSAHSIASTEQNLMTLLRDNHKLEYEEMLLAISPDGHPSAHILINERAELMHQKGDSDGAIRLLYNAIKKYESTKRPIFHFHLLLAEIYFEKGRQENKFLKLAKQNFLEAEKHFDHDQDYMKRLHGQKYLEYYADFSKRFCDFFLYIKEYGAIVKGLNDAFQKFDNAKLLVHNRQLLEMYFLEASIYIIEDKFHSDIQHNRISSIDQVQSSITVLKALKEKIDLLSIDFKQRTFSILYKSLNNILMATIKELEEDQLASIRSLFKKFAEELVDIIKKDIVTDININLKQITLEFLSMAAVYNGATEEATVYLEELILPKYQEGQAKYLRFLGERNLIIAKDIANSRSSNKYKDFIKKAQEYLNKALTIEQQSQNLINIGLIINFLEECDRVIPIENNSINTTTIVKILIRKIGVIIARQNILIVNGNAQKQLEQIKINSFELDKITNNEDFLTVRNIIFTEIGAKLKDGLIRIEINENKIVLVFKYSNAISIYSGKYYPSLADSDSSSLTYVEKLIITDKQISFMHKVSQFSLKEHLTPIVTYHDLQSSHFVASAITLLSETGHSVQHYINIEKLIGILNNSEICSNNIICLERKQQGNNLGMSDVIALADYLDHENTVPAALQNLPIYYDALLYNAAKAKGISVIGIEGKGLAYSKKSPYYHQGREKYMTEQLVEIARSGKNAIFLVGAAHISNLIKLLNAQGFRVDDSDSSLGQNLITLKSRQAYTEEFALPRLSTELATINYGDRSEDDLQPKTEILVHKTVQSYSFLSYIHEFAEQLDLNWQVQKLLHLTDLWKFELIKTKYGISASFDSFRGSNSDFRKSILLKLHPDKNSGIQDCNNDFSFVTNLREELNKPFDIQKTLDEKIQTIQPFIHKSNIGFKVFDTTVDTVRLIHTPTTNNAKKVLIDTTYLYSMYSGINGFTAIINGVDIVYKVYQDEYNQALTQALTTAGYMLVPAAISFVTIPYVGFMYGVTLTIYSGYGAINNAYSFYQEYYEAKFNLNSITAYKNLFETLSYSPLRYIYDFSKKAKEYEASLNNIKLELEKTYIKEQLEEKGEFGQKLYEYIYSPIIEEKYDLQNKVTQGILNEEEANQLKAKHIQIMGYDHCMEIAELKEEDQTDHYYCYKEEQQILDHIVIIGEAYVEKISSL